MRRILAVDDDRHICLAVRAWLERHGFKVAIADGGAAGLATLDSSTFDLRIVDVFMPDMRGFESISTFHDYAPAVPLIAISGYAFSGLERSSPDSLRMAIKLGATRCLRKPFRPATPAGRDRRMPAGGRAAPPKCRRTDPDSSARSAFFKSCQRGVLIQTKRE